MLVGLPRDVVEPAGAVDEGVLPALELPVADDVGLEVDGESAFLRGAKPKRVQLLVSHSWEPREK